MSLKLKKWFYLSALMILMAALAIPSLVYAGGWAVVTLDQLPDSVVAGQPYTLGFMVRQHGQTPWQVDEISIEAKQPQTGQTATFIAKPDQVPGHYQAELLFTQPGRWEWGIQSGLYPLVQPMPALEVTGVAATAAAGAKSTPYLPVGLLRGLALLAFAVGVVLIVRYRDKKLPRLAGGVLILVCAGLVFASFSSTSAEASQTQFAASLTTDRETGHQLFLAKGCVVCHVNERAMENAEQYSVAIGPNLSAYRNDPAYLQKFLANPQASKTTVASETTFPMPNLGLSPAEIEALVNFINDTESR